MGRARELPVTERGRATRRAILDAAEDVFAEQGFERASVSEITRRAGVAQGTFYVYFEDKKAAFLEVVETVNREVRVQSSAAAAQQPTRPGKEVAGFGAYFSHVAEKPALYRIIRQAEFVEEPAYQDHYARIAKGYVRGLTRAMESGEIADDVDPEILAYALMGIAEYMGMKLVLWEHRLPDDEAYRHLMRFVLRGLGVKQPDIDAMVGLEAPSVSG